MEIITVYHGSPKRFFEIHNGGLFGGIFCASDKDCAHEGGFVYEIELDRADIATSFELNYGERSVKAFEIACAVCGSEERATAALDDDSRDCVDADDSWELQRQRGEIARRLGFKAVAMSDEHGTSYLVLPGTTIKLI